MCSAPRQDRPRLRSPELHMHRVRRREPELGEERCGVHGSKVQSRGDITRRSAQLVDGAFADVPRSSAELVRGDPQEFRLVGAAVPSGSANRRSKRVDDRSHNGGHGARRGEVDARRVKFPRPDRSCLQSLRSPRVATALSLTKFVDTHRGLRHSSEEARLPRVAT